MSGCFKIHILSNKMYALTVTVNKKYYRYHTSFLFNNLFLVQYRILSYIILRRPGRLIRRPGRLMRGPGRSMRGSGRSMREQGRCRWGRGREGQSSFFYFLTKQNKKLSNLTVFHSLVFIKYMHNQSFTQFLWKLNLQNLNHPPLRQSAVCYTDPPRLLKHSSMRCGNATLRWRRIRNCAFPFCQL